MRRIKLAVLNIIAFAVLASAWASGTLDSIFLSDRTHVSLLISALIVVGVGAAFRDEWKIVKWIAEKLPALGLAATVYGILMLSYGAGADAGNIDAIRKAILTGVGAALGPNFTGIVGYVWLSTLAFAARGEDY